MPLFFRKYTFSLSLLAVSIFLFSCSEGNSRTSDTAEKQNETTESSTVKNNIVRTMSSSEVIMARRQVPVLCYHHIKYPKHGSVETFNSFSVSPVQFADQMKALHDSGYTTILPDQLYDYLAYGDPLPPKPVMITFDDTDEEQFTVGAKEMNKYGFKGVFFIMTISIGRPDYMTKEQIKELSQNGNAVESHTWDHKDVRKYGDADLQKELLNPRHTIEEITGKSAHYFAYPFGAWNDNGIHLLQKAGIKMAFILAAKRDPANPLYTVRRMMVSGTWTTNGMMQAMKKTFERNE